MKINDITERSDGYMVVNTTHGEFVYPQDKFKNLDEVKTEIIRSIAAKTKKNDKKNAKFDKVKDDLAKEKLNDA